MQYIVLKLSLFLLHRFDRRVAVRPSCQLSDLREAANMSNKDQQPLGHDDTYESG